jgi:hypothetical protein
MRRLPGGNQDHSVQPGLFAAGFREDQMPEMNRVEGAPIESNPHGDAALFW